MMKGQLLLLLVLWCACFSESNCYLKSLCSGVSGAAIKNGKLTYLYQFNDNKTDVCVLINHSLLQCYNYKCVGIKMIPLSLDGSYAIELVNLLSNVKERVNLHVSQLDSTLHTLDAIVSIDYPAFGTVVSKRLDIGITKYGASHIDSLYVDVVGVTQMSLDPDTTAIESKNADVQPGTMFYTITPQSHSLDSTRDNYLTQNGLPAHGYLEFVLSEKDIKRNRKYANYSTTPASPVAPGQFSAPPNIKFKRKKPINVCIFSGNKLDGQKQIWIQQSRHMNKSLFHFTWLMQDRRSSANTVVQTIENMSHITIGENPNFMVAAADLEENPGDGRPPASHHTNSDTTYLYRYAHDSLLRANHDIDQVRPAWCRNFYLSMRQTMQSHACEVVVFGNKGSFGTDVVITDTARVLQIPTVGELLNLNVHEDLVPTVLVAPSQFVAQHESTQAGIRAYRRNKITSPGRKTQSKRQRAAKNSESIHSDAGEREAGVVAVIPPSVDTDLFDPSRFTRNTRIGTNTRTSTTVASANAASSRQRLLPPAYTHPSCIGTIEGLNSEGSSPPCVVIAFVARLSAETQEILRDSLEALAARPQMDWAVHLTGWFTSTDLPQLLAGVDLVTTSGLVMQID